ncbi:MAG: molybdopterin synthase sulfur carrier subunit [Acidobacteria bacterium]|nr:MAG: molybdopterin synthase sulfur carrier subunit [Acidobacteriota bacterium]
MVRRGGARLPLASQHWGHYPACFDMAPAPTVTFHVMGSLRTYCAGAAQLSISGRTVRTALEDLERSQVALYRNVCDETGAVRRHLNVFVNADNVRDLNGVDTALTSGDVITILPAVSGG